MTTVATYSNAAEAELLHSLLADAGIDAFVPEDLFGGVIRVQVAEESAAEAKRILAEAVMTDDDTGQDQPR
jgi:hypothetical protein